MTSRASYNTINTQRNIKLQGQQLQLYCTVLICFSESEACQALHYDGKSPSHIAAVL